MRNDHDTDIDEMDLRENRVALRTAVGKLICQFIRESEMSQIEVSGASGLSRNTIRNLMTAGRGHGPSPTLDTIADTLSGLRVACEDFAARLNRALNGERTATAGEVEGEPFEVTVAGHILRGALICPEQVQIAK